MIPRPKSFSWPLSVPSSPSPLLYSPHVPSHPRSPLRHSTPTPEVKKPPKIRNGFAGDPPLLGIGYFFAVQVTIAGQPDASSGYLKKHHGNRRSQFAATACAIV